MTDTKSRKPKDAATHIGNRKLDSSRTWFHCPGPTKIVRCGFERRMRRIASAYIGLSAVVVAAVEPGGPADKGLLAAGDIVLSLDGVPITGADDLIRILTSEKIDHSVDLQLLRNGALQNVTLVPSERPSGGK